jgi:hypothetical protein
MATYLPQVTDQIPDLPLYQPNFGFFQQMMNRKTQMYEQGYSQVKSAYDSILNAPLSNNQNIQARDQYLKEAQDKLKNLSSVDLSMQQNVDAANNVFAPFWQDDKMLKDATFTRSYMTEMQKGMRLRDSKNKEDRDQYSDTAMQYLQNGLDKIKNLDRSDDNSWNNLEKRRFVPFMNETAYWDDEMKKADLKREWDEQSGQWLIKHTNGEQAIGTFETWAQAHMTPQMMDMHRVKGIVEKEQAIKLVQQQHPGITDDQAMDYVARDVVHDMRGAATSQLSSLKSNLEETNNKIAAFKKLGDIPKGSTLEQRLNDLVQFKDHLENDLIPQVQKRFDGIATDNAKDAASTIENIKSSPDHYFQSLSVSRSVHNWAVAAAGNEKVERVINPVWKEDADIAYKNATLNIQEKQLALEYRKEQWNEDHPTKNRVLGYDESGQPIYGSGSGSGTGTGSSGGPYGAELEHGAYRGQDTLDNTSQGSAADVFRASQTKKLNSSNEMIFSLEGLGHTLVGQASGSKGTITDGDVVTAFSAINRFNRQGGKLYGNDEETAALNKITDVLKAKTGADIKGPEGMRNALLAYAKQYFADKSSNGGLGMSAEDLQSHLIYQNALQSRQEFLNLQDKHNELMQKALASTKDPQLQKLIVTRPDGTRSLVDGSDIGNHFKDLVITDAHGKRISVSAEDMGNAFLQNKLSAVTHETADPYGGTHTYGWSIRVGNRNIDVDPSTYYRMNEKLSSVEKIYGNPSKFSDTFRNLAESTVPNIQDYQNKTGKAGSIIDYEIGEKGGRGNRLVQEAARPGNMETIMDGGQPASSDVIDAVQKLSKLGDKDLHKYVSSVTQHTGRNTLEVTFAPVKSTDKTEVGENGFDLNKLAGKTIEIKLSPDAKGPTISGLPSNSGEYIWGSILKGKQIKSDPLLEAAGYSYSIVPNDTSNPTYAYVTINHKMLDAKTGRYNDAPEIRERINFFGPDAKNPDELMDEIHSLFSRSVMNNQLSQQQFMNNNQSQGNMTNAQEIIDNYQKTKLLR